MYLYSTSSQSAANEDVYEDVYSPMKAAQQEHKHTDRNTNVKDRQRTELSKKYKNQDTRL